MDSSSKRKSLQKKLYEYTSVITPGQMTKLGESEVNHLHKVYLGRLASPEELKIYADHPDHKILVKNLQMVRKDKEKQEKMAMGQGGPVQNFGASLAGGASQLGQTLNNVLGPVQNPASNGGIIGQQFSNLSQAVQSTPQSLQQLGNMTTNYGEPTKFQKSHTGIDIANKKGTQIPVLFKGGTVESVGDAGGYGNQVVIKTPDGMTERYSHLYQAYVKPGQTVSKGQIIGSMGNTGNTYSLTGGDGTHLHYEIVDAFGKFTDPLKYFRS